ncbi:MAG: hypothetical protein COB90_00080 [Hyphomicrobiales bacterium]|nr:MAG: hypothetical protein COB90_00080 [Hyphomicrobiales bacterium]
MHSEASNAIDQPSDEGPIYIHVRKKIPASPQRVFQAWTSPEELKQWWGPRNVVCSTAEVDLRVGGKYRLGNEFPDGKIVWISGIFETVEQPAELVYTWNVDMGQNNPASIGSEKVSVRFEKHEIGTELVLKHERIPDENIKSSHLKGWFGCFDGLLEHLEDA